MAEIEISKIKIDENNLIIKDAQARENINSLSTNINNNLNSLSNIDNKIKNSIADEFNTTTSYNTNDLILHDSQLYKFTSNHEAGEWDFNEAVTTNISNNYLPLSGGTLTGSLTTSLQLVIKDNTIDTLITPESDAWPRHLIIKDKDNVDRGYVEVYSESNGIQGIQLETKRVINNNNFYNGLQLGIDPEGNRLVNITQPIVWRTALGANTNGIWPIEVGGTGQSGIETATATISASASSGTINIYKFGKIINIRPTNYIRLKQSIGQGGNVVVGTIPSGYRPIHDIRDTGGSYNNKGDIIISTDGNITFYANNAAANSIYNIYFNITYIID